MIFGLISVPMRVILLALVFLHFGSLAIAAPGFFGCFRLTPEQKASGANRDLRPFLSSYLRMLDKTEAEVKKHKWPYGNPHVASIDPACIKAALIVAKQEKPLRKLALRLHAKAGKFEGPARAQFRDVASRARRLAQEFSGDFSLLAPEWSNRDLNEEKVLLALAWLYTKRATILEKAEVRLDVLQEKMKDHGGSGVKAINLNGPLMEGPASDWWKRQAPIIMESITPADLPRQRLSRSHAGPLDSVSDSTERHDEDHVGYEGDYEEETDSVQYTPPHSHVGPPLQRQGHPFLQQGSSHPPQVALPSPPGPHREVRPTTMRPTRRKNRRNNNSSSDIRPGEYRGVLGLQGFETLPDDYNVPVNEIQIDLEARLPHPPFYPQQQQFVAPLYPPQQGQLDNFY